MSSDDLFAEGLRTRREVLGAANANKSLTHADALMMAFQQMTTEWRWGAVWNRAGLDRRTRSLITLAMLTALGRSSELRWRVRGALTNGVTIEEIRGRCSRPRSTAGFPRGSRRSTAPTSVLEQAAAQVGQLPQTDLSPAHGDVRAPGAGVSNE